MQVETGRLATVPYLSVPGVLFNVKAERHITEGLEVLGLANLKYVAIVVNFLYEPLSILVMHHRKGGVLRSGSWNTH